MKFFDILVVNILHLVVATVIVLSICALTKYVFDSDSAMTYSLWAIIITAWIMSIYAYFYDRYHNN